MAESMQGLHRSHRCTEVSNANIGEKVTVMGWVQKRRNLGSLIFVDLRDRSGIMQLIFENGSIDEEGFAKAGKLRSEFVIAVTGVVEERGGAVNKNLATGEIELRVKSLRVLSEAEVPPFPIEENCKTKDEIRLKYRYLDLRRPDLQKNIMLKSKVMMLTRQFFAKEGFLEIETPMLGKSTPEGARDYLVPSRVHPGHFYGLPQSPQLYKQLLMCSGYDRYIQIVKCFRDEDLRADRQPEFTQLDMEMAYVDQEDVMAMTEKVIAAIWKSAGYEVQLPLPRITWRMRWTSTAPTSRTCVSATRSSSSPNTSRTRRSACSRPTTSAPSSSRAVPPPRVVSSTHGRIGPSSVAPRASPMWCSPRTANSRAPSPRTCPKRNATV